MDLQGLASGAQMIKYIINHKISLVMILIILILTPNYGFAASSMYPVVEPSSEISLNADGLRSVTNYHKLDAETLLFYKRAKINMIYWCGPFYGYTGLPKRSKLNMIMRNTMQTVQQAHDLGIKILLYVGPVFSYGNEIKRTQLFDFYDNEWDNYIDYLGTKPTDPITWTQRSQSDKPIPYTWKKHQGYYLCPNNINLQRYMHGILKLLIETGADGVFYDGPIFKNGRCYCNACKAKFAEGMRSKYSPMDLKSMSHISSDIPFPTNASDLLWVEWQEFFADSLHDFLKEMKDYACKLKPDFIITSNYWIGDPYNSLLGQATDANKWSKVVDILFCESGYNTGPFTENGNKFSNSYLYKYLSASSHDRPISLLKTSINSPKPEAQYNLTKLCIAEASANHGVWQFYKLNKYAQQAAIQYNNFLVDNAALYKGWSPYADIAVLTSPRQIYYRSISYDAAVSRYLTDHHIMHRIIREEEISPQKLSQFKIIIFPGIKVLSDESLGDIRTYAQNGGIAIFLGKTAYYDTLEKGRDVHAFFMQTTNDTYQGKSNQLEVGCGKIIFCPIPVLPPKVRESLSQNTISALNRLLDIIDNSLKHPRMVLSKDDPSVELMIYRKDQGEGQTHAIHMVNYAIDSAGKVTEKHGLELLIHLPPNTRCDKAILYSPDLNDNMEKIDLTIKNSDNQKYAKIIIKRLSIYSILVLNLKTII